MQQCLNLDEFIADYPAMMHTLESLHFALLLAGFLVGAFVVMFTPSFARSVYTACRFFRRYSKRAVK